ncbi:peptidoglycan DD-metalloendopeptidase family protein, partial [Leptospira noguchii]|uniref:peptidoglycan DD-metalloendopeptidase family protein n=1 Tax=Leptospira noguchii TaxID=28182 RepID=UPI0007739AE7
YYALGEEITGEVDNRGLTYTRNSFLNYRDTLLNKNFQNSTQIQKQIQEGKNQVAGILTEGENYNQIQGMLQSAQNLNQQGAENKERVEKLLAQSKELAEKNIGEGLLDGLQEMIASIQSSLPQEVSNNGVSQYIQAQEKELAEKQEKANELLSHMNSLVTNNNDLAALQALLQGSSQGLNLAANSAVSKYLDDYAKKLQKDNEERSSNLQKTLLESLTNGDDYKYLRDAGYGFRVDGEGITAYREVYSGEIEINGSAMKSTSYSPDLEYQYIRIETKFNPGNLSVDMLNPNNTTFSAEMVSSVKGYIDNLQKNVEVMFAQFSDKTKEVKEEYVQNEEIESYQKKLYEASKDNYLAAFQGLPGEFKEMFEGEMGGLKNYHEQGSKYNFGQGSFKGQNGDMKKIGKSMYDGAIIDDTVFAGSRELKGSVSVKGIPVEVSYGMQYLIVTSGFEISNLGYNFNLKGLGTNYVDNQLSGVSQKYSIYTKDIQSRIERQAKANDEEMDKKGFVFNVLNGMSGGQKVTQAVEGEIRSRVTGAIAEATGLPASFVGALVGGSNMKQAMKAYEKSVTTEAISKATGIPSWYLDQKIAEKEANHAMTTSFSYNMATTLVGSLKYSPPLLAAQALIPGLKEDVNKFVDHVGREAYKNRETIDAAVTVAMTVAAPMTGGMSLVALAGYNVVKGATEGGVLGALAGVANIGNAYLSTYTFGAVSYNLSYSYADGFGASVGGGWQVAKGLGVGATLSYNEQSGFGASVGFQAGTSALSFNGGLSYSQRDGVSANAGVGIGLGGKKPTGSLNLGVSYNKQDGLGTSAGISSNNNKITHGMGLNITRSEYGGWGADVSSDNYGPGNLSGGLAYTQRDGFTVSLNVNGTNAFNYNSQSGLSSNTDFMSQYAMNNGLAQGVAEDTDTSEPNSAQQHNNAEQGAQVIEGAGVSTTRREGEGGDAVDQRIAQLKKELSEGISLAHDNGTMSDAGNPALASAAKELSSKMAELQKLEGQKAAGQKPGVQKDGSIVVAGSNKPTLGERASSLFGSIADGVKGLWNKVTGGGNKSNSNGHEIVRIGENGLAEYANGARTSIPFNEKTDGPFSQPRTGQIHGAVDLMTPIGTKVSALEDGVVTIARNKPDDYLRYPVEPGKNTKLGGASVSIRHTNANGETVYSYYAHNSEVRVRDGEKVVKGQVIALSGQSGNTPGGPHIHQEVNKYVDGKRTQIDPLEFSWEKFNANKNGN